MLSYQCRLVPDQGMKMNLVVGCVRMWLVPPFPLDSRFASDEFGGSGCYFRTNDGG